MSRRMLTLVALMSFAGQVSADEEAAAGATSDGRRLTFDPATGNLLGTVRAAGVAGAEAPAYE